MEHPENYKNIATGRSSLDDWLKKHYNEFYNFLKEKYPNCPIKESLYMYYNNINSQPTCKNCGKKVKFHGYAYGFGEFCCSKCAQNDKDVRLKLHETNIKKYGENYMKIFSQKGLNTKNHRYGNIGYNNNEKRKQTCLERYGVDNPMKSKQIQEKSKQTCLERYGNQYYLSSEEYDKKKEQSKKKSKQTCLERYGVEYNCLRPEAHNSKNMYSSPNQKFKDLLELNNIQYEREKNIKGKSYDFLVGDTLIEINPYPTHNINWSPFKDKQLDIDYHFNKTQLAKNNNYKIINIWDWDDPNKIIKSLLPKKKIYARECVIKNVKRKESNDFLNKYHFQNTCKNQKIRIGLYYKGELIQIMTFGKPRYNQKYQYELLRLCTKFEYMVIGGSNKLFSFFVKNYNPQHIISYCDNSKFIGGVYSKLGFQMKSNGIATRHWYNGKTNIHITDNLLRQRGFDQLFNTSYGKSISNNELMRSHGFVEIYDAGQSVWVWCK